MAALDSDPGKVGRLSGHPSPPPRGLSNTASSVSPCPSFSRHLGKLVGDRGLIILP